MRENRPQAIRPHDERTQAPAPWLDVFRRRSITGDSPRPSAPPAGNGPQLIRATGERTQPQAISSTALTDERTQATRSTQGPRAISSGPQVRGPQAPSSSRAHDESPRPYVIEN